MRAAGADPADRSSLPWRVVLAGPIVAAATLAFGLVATGIAGVPLRDPGHVTVVRLLVATALVLVLAGVDITVRAGRRGGTLRPAPSLLRAVARERWSRRRAVAVAVALLAFFVTYLAYRNVKSVVPLLRPGDLFDHQLSELDQNLFGGHDPAAALHSVLGTGAAAHLLAPAYMLFFVFIPVSLAVALVWAPDARSGLFYVTALAIAWPLGAVSYLLVPSLGPFQADPTLFSHLPLTSSAHLQTLLLDERFAFLVHPTAPGAAQSIGAFASLHVAVYATAALTAHLLGLARPLKVVVWVLLGLTALATIYFGWHYVLDDVGGVAIAVVAVGLARALTGVELRTMRLPRGVPVPEPEPEPA